MKKDKPIKIRREWKINPRERIREDKEPDYSSPCERCKNISVEQCKDCEYYYD